MRDTGADSGVLVVRFTPARRLPEIAPLALRLSRVHGRPDGLPRPCGLLTAPAPLPITLTWRVHNSGGVPIAEGRTQVGAGSRRFAFRAVRPIGFDAYAHLPGRHRQDIAWRIWSRRAYAILSIAVTAAGEDAA